MMSKPMVADKVMSAVIMAMTTPADQKAAWIVSAAIPIAAVVARAVTIARVIAFIDADPHWTAGEEKKHAKT